MTFRQARRFLSGIVHLRNHEYAGSDAVLFYGDRRGTRGRVRTAVSKGFGGFRMEYQRHQRAFVEHEPDNRADYIGGTGLNMPVLGCGLDHHYRLAARWGEW